MIILICFAFIPCVVGFQGLFMDKVYPKDRFKCVLALLGGGIATFWLLVITYLLYTN